MKSYEKFFAIAISSILFLLIFYQFSYVRSSDDVQSAASAITFLPYALGPCLISAYREHVTRLSFYSVMVFFALSPISEIIFIISLIIAIWPISEDSHADSNAVNEATSCLSSPKLNASDPQPEADPKYAIVVTKELVLKVKNKLIERFDVNKVAKEFNISKSTVYKIKRNQYDHLF